MTLTGEKLSNLLEMIVQLHEVSAYYKRYLLREGYIARELRPIAGRGRPGYSYRVTDKGLQAIASVRGAEYVATQIIGG